MSSTEQPKVFWQSDLALRWNRTSQTIRRWRLLGLIAAPDVRLAGREGWSLELVERIERGESQKDAAA